MQRVRDTIDRAVADGSVPSASICVVVDGRESFHYTAGRARLDPPVAATVDQAYDLASLTKALAGSTVLGALVERGIVGFDDPIARWFPEVDGRMRIRHLLTHASGLPWWRPLYAWVLPNAPTVPPQTAAAVEGEFARPPGVIPIESGWGTAATRAEVLRIARQLPLDAAPGERHAYSDIGMIVLMQVLEAATGVRLDALLRTLILAPAGIDDLRFGGWPMAAATELCPFRGGLVEGTVHDLNCAVLGGVSAHAGLFGTSRAVATLADRLRRAVHDPDGDPAMPGRALGEMWAMRGPGSHSGIWDTRTPNASSSGRFWPDDSRGHLGFTGTSVWIAPSRRVSVALLTNRVHPHDAKEAIRVLRPRVHDAVAEDLGWTT